MLGGAEEWFYRGLGGIDFDLSRAELSKRITIRPQMVAGVDWVRCSYHSALGIIVSDWQRENTTTIMHVTVPVGTEATIYVPVRAGAYIFEGSALAEKAAGVMLLNRDEDVAVYRVQSGEYHFSVIAH